MAMKICKKLLEIARIRTRSVGTGQAASRIRRLKTAYRNTMTSERKGNLNLIPL